MIYIIIIALAISAISSTAAMLLCLRELRRLTVDHMDYLESRLVKLEARQR